MTAPETAPGTAPGTAAWSWLDDTAFGPVAFLLLVPPDGRGEGLAAALGLAEPGARLPDISDRVTVLGPERVSVQGIGIPVGPKWTSFVDSGGPVALLVGLDPLPSGAERPEVEAYVAAKTLTGRLRLGVSAGGDGPPESGGPSRAGSRQ